MSWKDEMQITITKRQAMFMHYALEEFAKHINRDTDKDLITLREIDKLIGYSGNIDYE